MGISLLYYEAITLHFPTCPKDAEYIHLHQFLRGIRYSGTLLYLSPTACILFWVLMTPVTEISAFCTLCQQIDLAYLHCQYNNEHMSLLQPKNAHQIRCSYTKCNAMQSPIAFHLKPDHQSFIHHEYHHHHHNQIIINTNRTLYHPPPIFPAIDSTTCSFRFSAPPTFPTSLSTFR